MPPDQPEAGPKLDAATICRLARLVGLELEPARAERCGWISRPCSPADRRLAALDFGDCAAPGDLGPAISR